MKNEERKDFILKGIAVSLFLGSALYFFYIAFSCLAPEKQQDKLKREYTHIAMSSPVQGIGDIEKIVGKIDTIEGNGFYMFVRYMPKDQSGYLKTATIECLSKIQLGDEKNMQIVYFNHSWYVSNLSKSYAAKEDVESHIRGCVAYASEALAKEREQKEAILRSWHEEGSNIRGEADGIN